MDFCKNVASLECLLWHVFQWGHNQQSDVVATDTMFTVAMHDTPSSHSSWGGSKHVELTISLSCYLWSLVSKHIRQQTISVHVSMGFRSLCDLNPVDI